MFWPKIGITKGELQRYYVQISPRLLPVIPAVLIELALSPFLSVRPHHLLGHG